jgi:hypothetical protein
MGCAALTEHLVAVFPSIHETEHIYPFVRLRLPLFSSVGREALRAISRLKVIQERSAHGKNDSDNLKKSAKKDGTV